MKKASFSEPMQAAFEPDERKGLRSKWHRNKSTPAPQMTSSHRRCTTGTMAAPASTRMKHEERRRSRSASEISVRSSVSETVTGLVRQSSRIGAVVKRRTRRDIRLDPCCSNGDRDVEEEDDDEEGGDDSDEWAAKTTTAVAFLVLLLWLFPRPAEAVGRPRPVMGCVSPGGVGVARLNIHVVLPLNRTLV